MSTRRIRIAQIGIGHNHAQGKMDALRKLGDVFDLVGVVETNPEWRARRANWPCYEGVTWLSEEALFAIPDLQAVAIETDGFDLIPSAQRYAERGLHIHLDKPGGESLPDFLRLARTCRKRCLAFQLAYVFRYNPAIRFAMQAVKAGWLGDIFEIHAVMSRYDGDSPDYRAWLRQFKGGAMYIFAGYLVDIVIAMLGAPDRVTPFLKQTRSDGLIDNGLAVLEYPQATATLRVSVAEVEGHLRRRFMICGTAGTLEICPVEVQPQGWTTQPLTCRLTLKQAVGGYSAGTQQVACGLMGDRYAGQLREFARIIAGDMANPYDYPHEWLVQKTLLEASGFETWKGGGL